MLNISIFVYCKAFDYFRNFDLNLQILNFKDYFQSHIGTLLSYLNDELHLSFGI